MNIAPSELAAEYVHARHLWGVHISAAEAKHGLPPLTLYAFGSKETNLNPYYAEGAHVGADGHGHGLWQRDDRYHAIPHSYDVAQQADDAAAMIAGLLKRHGGDIRKAADAYNAGSGAEAAGERQGNPDLYTTDHDYGLDVAERQAWLHKHMG